MQDLMLQGEKAIKITHQMYKCRDQSVFLLGAKRFKNEVVSWAPTFDAIMIANGCDLLSALVELLQRAKGRADEGLLMHILTAVGCKLLEPKYTIEENLQEE